MRKCLTLLIFLTSLISANLFAEMDPIGKYQQKLSLQPIVEDWIEQINPKVKANERKVIANHLIFNAAANDLPLEFLVAVIATESHFKTKAVSPTGAKGIAQIIPYWHKKRIKGRNLFDPKVGLEVGSGFLKECLDRKKGSHRRALNCYSGYSGKALQKYRKTVHVNYQKFQQHLLASLTTKHHRIQIASLGNLY